MDHVTLFKNDVQESPFTDQEFTISDVKKLIRYKYKSFRATIPEYLTLGVTKVLAR